MTASMLPEAYVQLKSYLAELHDLGKTRALLNWDQAVTMPRGGAAARAEQLATISRITHDRFVSPEIGRLLDALESYESSMPYDSDEASLIRLTRHDYQKACRVPTELSAELARTASLSRQAWGAARANADYEAFRPFLERTLDLKRRYVALFDGHAEPYDVLLDDYERGMTSAEVRTIFDAVKAAIVPLIAQVADNADAVTDACLHGDFPVDAQRRLCLSILYQLGFTDDQWRLDPTTHPFASGTSLGDIRLTTRYYEHHLSPALFGTMHEFGHGLYEHGVSPDLERTPLCHGTSLGIHESQSRLWENVVGRSRSAWTHFLPEVQRAFPDRFGHVDLDTVYRAVNKVEPGLIRVEADELTYSLHVILRFELEQELLAGTLDLAELPEIWNARMKAYLGVDVPDAAHGVLQDVHWSLGLLGYFPTYVLGSIVSLQFWGAARAAHPDLDHQMARGEFAPLREWLRSHLHRHGSKFTPKETLKRAIGADGIDVAPFVTYLRDKFSALYGLD